MFDIAIFTVGMNLFVLLGNPVYRRWFLDGSDPDVRLVELYVSTIGDKIVDTFVKRGVSRYPDKGTPHPYPLDIVGWSTSAHKPYGQRYNTE